MEARSGLASLSPFRPQKARIGKHVVVQKTEPRGPFSYSVQLAEPRNVQVFCLHSAVISLGEYTDGVRLIIKFFLYGFREEFTQPFSKSVGRTILTEGSPLEWGYAGNAREATGLKWVNSTFQRNRIR